MAADGCQCCRDAELLQGWKLRRGSAVWFVDLDGNTIGRKAPDFRPFRLEDHPLGDLERPGYLGLHAEKLVANLVNPTDDKPGRIYLLDRTTGLRTAVFEFENFVANAAIDPDGVVYCLELTETEGAYHLERLDNDGLPDATAAGTFAGRIVFDSDGTLLVLPVTTSTGFARASADLVTISRGYSVANLAGDLAANGEILRYGQFDGAFYRNRFSWVNDQASLTTRTSDTEGVITARDDHTVEVGDSLTLYYAAGMITESVTDLEVTAVSGNEITVEQTPGGSGTLPDEGDAVILDRLRDVSTHSVDQHHNASLTTRTSDTQGLLTGQDDHAVEVGDILTLYFPETVTESVTNLEVTAVSGNEITVEQTPGGSGTLPDEGTALVFDRVREIPAYFIAGEANNPGFHVAADNSADNLGGAYVAIGRELMVQRVDHSAESLWFLDLSEELSNIRAIASADADGVFVAGRHADLSGAETPFGLDISEHLIRISADGEILWNIAIPQVINPHSLVYDRAAQELAICGQIWPPDKFMGRL